MAMLVADAGAAVGGPVAGALREQLKASNVLLKSCKKQSKYGVAWANLLARDCSHAK
jgi:hypothetical protein